MHAEGVQSMGAHRMFCLGERTLRAQTFCIVLSAETAAFLMMVVKIHH